MVVKLKSKTRSEKPKAAFHDVLETKGGYRQMAEFFRNIILLKIDQL